MDHTKIRINQRKYRRLRKINKIMIFMLISLMGIRLVIIRMLIWIRLFSVSVWWDRRIGRMFGGNWGVRCRGNFDFFYIFFVKYWLLNIINYSYDCKALIHQGSRRIRLFMNQNKHVQWIQNIDRSLSCLSFKKNVFLN